MADPIRVESIRLIPRSGSPFTAGQTGIYAESSDDRLRLVNENGTIVTPTTPPADGTAGTPSLRTLGTGANQAAPGNAVVTSLTAGTGLTGTASTGSVTLNVGGGPGITVGADQVAVDSENFVVVGYRNDTDTTDATPTVANSLVIPRVSQTYNIEARVAAFRHDGTQGATYILVAAARANNLGTLTQIGSTSTIAQHEDNPAWNATIQFSGNEIRVVVTGAAGVPISWGSSIRVFYSLFDI